MEKRKNQGQEWEDEEVIDLGEIFYALLRKLWVIIASAEHTAIFCSHRSTAQRRRFMY